MRPRPAKVCTTPGCPLEQPCPTHKPTPWAGSTRSQRLPPNWSKIRRRVIARDHGRCQWPDCGAPGTEVDHITRGDNHTLANLQLLCAPHHKTKTASEAADARRGG